MPSIMDVADDRSIVTIKTRAGQEIPIAVGGVDFDGFCSLFRRFSELRNMFSEFSEGTTAETLLDLGPSIVAAVCAAGTWKDETSDERWTGDRAAEERYRKLPIGTQAELVSEVWASTFPKGVAVAIQTLREVATAVGGVTAAADTSEPTESETLETI
jgi:hypothetical protein